MKNYLFSLQLRHCEQRKIHNLEFSMSPYTLYDTFLHGLAAHLKDALADYEVPSSLDGAIDLAIRVDLWVQACLREKRQTRDLVVAGEVPTEAAPWPEAPSGEEEPIQLGSTLLTGEECRRCRQSNLCLFCGGQGHFVATCPVRSPDSPVTGGILVSPIISSPQQPRLSLQVCFLLLWGPT